MTSNSFISLLTRKTGVHCDRVEWFDRWLGIVDKLAQCQIFTFEVIYLQTQMELMDKCTETTDVQIGNGSNLIVVE
jgi:hypothetical protein